MNKLKIKIWRWYFTRMEDLPFTKGLSYIIFQNFPSFFFLHLAFLKSFDKKINSMYLCTIPPQVGRAHGKVVS